MRLWERREINRNGRQVAGRFSEECHGVGFLLFCVREEEPGHLRKKTSEEQNDWSWRMRWHAGVSTHQPSLPGYTVPRISVVAGNTAPGWPQNHSPLFLGPCVGINPGVLLWHSQGLLRKFLAGYQSREGESYPSNHLGLLVELVMCQLVNG